MRNLLQAPTRYIITHLLAAVGLTMMIALIPLYPLLVSSTGRGILIGSVYLILLLTYFHTAKKLLVYRRKG